MAFFVIAAPAGLSPAEIERLAEVGSEHLPVEIDYPTMMSEAGFEEVETVDVTLGYEETLLAWLTEWEAESTELRSLHGADEFEERQARRRHGLDAISDGLLHRYLVSGVRR